MTDAATATKTDAATPSLWGISDEVTQLREWGTGIAYPLPLKHEVSILGAESKCWLRLWDPSGRISRRHASLAWGDRGWTITDLESKNGIYIDGTRVASASVQPGAEIRIGSITLLAESPRFVALRALLERLIGWGEDRREEIDQALFSIRIAATHREPLLLCGAGNLVPIAWQLHQHVLGDRPFVVSKPRSPHARGMDAFAAASGGTLCVWRNQQPDDFDEIVAALRSPFASALLIVCAHALPRGADIASQIVTVVRSILLPAPSDRPRELSRIIDAYATDAAHSMGGGWITAADRDWIAENASSSLHQIEMATRRIVALHACGESITVAAKRLGITHGTLSDWMARRTLPGRSPLPDEDEESTVDR